MIRVENCLDIYFPILHNNKNNNNVIMYMIMYVK